jgi:hypothetical protein
MFVPSHSRCHQRWLILFSLDAERMIKAVYFAAVIVILLPSVIAAVASLQCARTITHLQANEQSRTTDSVYVFGESNFAVGPFRVSVYPHVWAAILVLLGIALCIVGAAFLFFVRPW